MIDPPSNIRAHQAEQVLEVSWPDGTVDRLPYRYLRAECPCASCQDEWTGERIIRIEHVREDLKLEGLEMVGTYAIQPAWSDGHSTGMFTWELLREALAASAGPNDRVPPGTAPRLTVALPTCNGEAHLADALAGVLGQDCEPFDLLVCDDRSDDSTVDLVRALGGDRARVEINPERLGLAGNWNRCVALSRTPWVAVFHQDDLMRDGDLRRRLRALDGPEADDLGLIAGPADVVDERDRPVPGSVVDPGGIDDGPCVFPPGAFSARLAGANVLRCSAVTTSKRAHEAVGGFDPSYRYVVDWDFWLRAADRFAVAWTGGPPMVSIRWHAASETHRFKAGLGDLEETERLLAARGSSPGFRLARAYLNRAHDALKAGRADLARTALRRAFRTSPSVLGPILADPRLAIQMAALATSPGLARRLFAR